jgi:hypothetical protein
MQNAYPSGNQMPNRCTGCQSDAVIVNKTNYKTRPGHKHPRIPGAPKHNTRGESEREGEAEGEREEIDREDREREREKERDRDVYRCRNTNREPGTVFECGV